MKIQETVNIKLWGETAQNRLSEDALLRHTGLKLERAEANPARAWMHWPRQSLPSSSPLDSEGIVNLIGREVTWLAGTIALNSFDAGIHTLKCRFVRAAPQEADLFGTAVAEVYGVDAEDGYSILHADVSGTVYYKDDRDESVYIANLRVRVCPKVIINRRPTCAFL